MLLVRCVQTRFSWCGRVNSRDIDLGIFGCGKDSFQNRSRPKVRLLRSRWSSWSPLEGLRLLILLHVIDIEVDLGGSPSAWSKVSVGGLGLSHCLQMERRLDPENVAYFLPSVVLLLQNVVDTMLRPRDEVPPDEREGSVDVSQVHEALINMNSIVASVLHDSRIVHATTLLDQELGWWVMPRSTSWFSRFVLQEYDD